MNDETKTMELEMTKNAIPCLWECGGGYTNTGDAQIITDMNGYPKRAIHIRTSGDLACKDHALIPVREGDHVVTVNRHRDKVAVRVERIVTIQGDTATLTPDAEPICVDAIGAAVSKSNDYHCRTPYYIRED